MRRPLWVTPRAPASPLDPTSESSSISVNAFVSAAGSWEVAMMSRSLQVSVMRRALPAISTRSADGCARRCSTICSPIVSTADRRMRSAGPSSSCLASAFAMFCSAFGPSPGIARRRSASAASRSSSSVEMPSSS